MSKHGWLIPSLSSLVIAGITIASGGQTVPVHSQVPVIVELFTSEGCSSCPPADDVLALLDRTQPFAGIEVLALEEHVNYWNSGGWIDRFSDALFTQRQKEYADTLHLPEVYTPQIVVDGVVQLNGADVVAVRKAVQVAAGAPHLSFSVTSPVANGHSLQVSVSLKTSPIETDIRAELQAALVQANATTVVHSGENGGRTLHHAAIVRRLKSIGALSDLQRGPKSFSLSVPSDVPLASLRVVVFAQSSKSGRIIGSGASTLATP